MEAVVVDVERVQRVTKEACQKKMMFEKGEMSKLGFHVA